MSKNNEIVYDYKYLKDTMVSLGCKYDIWKVFNDFLEMITYAFANVTNFSNKREKRYLEIINSYKKEEQELFPNMLSSLVNSLNADKFNDVLGTLYEELGLYNKFKGQFFTPPHICDLMSNVTINKEEINKVINDKGYFCINDCACGSGRLFYSSLKFMKENDIDYHRQVFIEAQDVSSFCVYMTYIQLTLYGANAIVILGNTLTNEIQDIFYTPFAILFPISDIH